MNSKHSEFDLPTRPLENKEPLINASLNSTQDELSDTLALKQGNSKKLIYSIGIAALLIIIALLVFYNIKLNAKDEQIVTVSTNNKEQSVDANPSSSDTTPSQTPSEVEATTEEQSNNVAYIEEFFEDKENDQIDTTDKVVSKNKNQSNTTKPIKKRVSATPKTNPLNSQLLFSSNNIREVNTYKPSLEEADISYQENPNYLEAKKLYHEGFIASSTNKNKSISYLEKALALAPPSTMLRQKIESQIQENKTSVNRAIYQ